MKNTIILCLLFILLGCVSKKKTIILNRPSINVLRTSQQIQTNFESIINHKTNKKSGDLIIDSYGRFTIQSTPLTGKYTINYKDSSYIKFFLKEGYLNGAFKKYFPKSNQVQIEGNYVNNIKEGIWKLYKNSTSNFYVSKESKYLKGELKYFIYYNIKGKPKEKLLYQKDIAVFKEEYLKNNILAKGPINELEQKNGRWEQYHQDTLLISNNWDNNKLNGNYLTYYKNGKIKEQYSYNQDSLEGDYISYYKNGTIELIGAYAKNKQSGEWHVFNSHKKLKELICFDGAQNLSTIEWIFIENVDSVSVNLQTGLRNYFYKDGKILAKGIYQKGKRNGKWELFYNNGTLYSSGNFINNKRDGEWNTYYENGNLKDKHFYKKGIKYNKSIFYDKQGNTTLTNYLDNKGTILRTEYANLKAQKESERSEFIDFYIINSKGERTSEYYDNSDLFFVIKTKNKIGESMDIDLSDNSKDYNAYKICNIYLYNVAISNYILKKDLDKIKAKPQMLYRLKSLKQDL